METAKNTVFFKAFNDDYRQGGVLSKLDNTEFRTIVIMQSYADSKGIVSKGNGFGHNSKDLCAMIGLNYRTLKKSLMGLEKSGLIRITDTDEIIIKSFVYDQTERAVNNITKKERAIQTRLSKTEKLTKDTAKSVIRHHAKGKKEAHK